MPTRTYLHRNQHCSSLALTWIIAKTMEADKNADWTWQCANTLMLAHCYYPETLLTNPVIELGERTEAECTCIITYQALNILNEPIVMLVLLRIATSTVSPRINVHAPISEIRLFWAWRQKYSCSFMNACTYIRILRAYTYIRKLLHVPLCNSRHTAGENNIDMTALTYREYY